MRYIGMQGYGNSKFLPNLLIPAANATISGIGITCRIKEAEWPDLHKVFRSFHGYTFL